MERNGMREVIKLMNETRTISDATIVDTMESITSAMELRVDYLEDQLQNKEVISTKRKKYWIDKKASQEQAPFTKTYHEGVEDMKTLKQNGEVSFSDIGKLYMLTRYIEKDTGMLVDYISNKPMNIAGMAKEIGDSKQNIQKTFERLIRCKVVAKQIIDGTNVYFVNPQVAFNGISRASVNKIIFNNCTFNTQIVNYC